MGKKIDKLVQDSRLAPSGDGNSSSLPYCSAPSSGQKWWLAILLGIVFALIVNPVSCFVTNYIATGLGSIPLLEGCGLTLAGLLVHTVIFVLCIRLILW